MKKHKMRGEGQAWIKANQGKHFCQCGCGSLLVIMIHHSTRGIPRFVHGHGSRIENPMSGRNGKKNPNYKFGRWIRKDGYVLILLRGNKKQSKYILEHRLVMQKFLGRKLKRNEIVHHKNGNRSDNRIENLELLSNSEHTSLHAKRGDVGFGRKKR